MDGDRQRKGARPSLRWLVLVPAGASLAGLVLLFLVLSGRQDTPGNLGVLMAGLAVGWFLTVLLPGLAIARRLDAALEGVLKEQTRGLAGQAQEAEETRDRALGLAEARSNFLASMSH